MDLDRLKHMPAITVAMTPFPYSVETEDSVTRAEEQMRVHGLRHLPVSEDGQLVGIVTDRDIARHVNEALPESDRNRIKIRQVCTLGAYVVDVSAPLDGVLMHLAEHHIGSALVVKSVGDTSKLVGILTLSDVCVMLAEILRERFTPDDDVVA